MKRSTVRKLSVLLAASLPLAGGACGRGWSISDRQSHGASETFESFYWKLQKHDLAAASSHVLAGSDAEIALTVERAIADAEGARADAARGFSLEVSLEPDRASDGRTVVRIHGEATVRFDPAGYFSAFGVPEIHDVEAHLVEDRGTWRVATYSDLRR